MKLVVGVDSSTQSVKVEARNIETGELVAKANAKHPPTQPPNSEQDPRSWWNALVEAISQLGDHRKQVVAISIAGQQHGLVLLDEFGEPVRPAKLWNDTTSAPQAERLVAQFGAESIAQRTGSVPVAAFTISKLAWVAENEPEVLRRAVNVMLPHDYLNLQLSGEHVTDRGDASGTGWFNPRTGNYESDLFAAASDNWQGAKPRVLKPNEVVGTITKSAAAMLGLPTNVIVAPGTGDNMAGALGLGLRAGDLAISLGTSGTVYGLSDSPTTDATGAVAGFASASGNYLPLVCTLNATKVTDTVAQWLGVSIGELAQLAINSVLDPGTVTMVPYFDGERTPNLPQSTGTFLGLTNQTTREQIALAAHDGVLCGLLAGVNALVKAGASLGGRVFLIGGGSRSIAFRQRAADLMGLTITVPTADETVATGAAVQAAAIFTGQTLENFAQTWQLGTGAKIEPLHDCSDRRATYDLASSLESHNFREYRHRR